MLFGWRLWFDDRKIGINTPDLIPKFGQLPLIFWIKSEFRLWINNDPRIESSTAEHHSRLDVGIPVENALWVSC